MTINLVSNDLKNYLLNKFNEKNINNLDLNKIEELSLNAFKNDGTLADYDFKDFEKFKELKYLSLQNFIIKNYETNVINRCKKIEGIQFSNCLIKSKSRLQGNIKIISFENCKKIRLRYIALLKNLLILKISNLKRINLNKIVVLRKLQKIYFENIKILNFAKLSFLKNLIYIKIIECRWNKKAEAKLPEYIQIEKQRFI